MEYITELLKENHEVFTKELGFEIQDYDYSPEFGGSTYIIYVKNTLSLLVTKSRDGIIYKLGGGPNLKKRNWFSLNIMRHFLKNMETYKKLKPVNPIKFISENINEFENAFSKKNLDFSVAKLNDLKRKRAKKLF